MFGFKKLLKRIISLESFIGVRYSPTDDDVEYFNTHLKDGDWGFDGRIKELEKEVEKINKSLE